QRRDCPLGGEPFRRARRGADPWRAAAGDRLPRRRDDLCGDRHGRNRAGARPPPRAAKRSRGSQLGSLGSWQHTACPGNLLTRQLEIFTRLKLLHQMKEQPEIVSFFGLVSVTVATVDM